jgi:hypothetical protein
MMVCPGATRQGLGDFPFNQREQIPPSLSEELVPKFTVGRVLDRFVEVVHVELADKGLEI